MTIAVWQADDIRSLAWAAEQLGIGVSTAYRLALSGAIPGAFKVGAQWRVSVPKFMAEVHGGTADGDLSPGHLTWGMEFMKCPDGP
jgi:hypothetical protein